MPAGRATIVLAMPACFAMPEKKVADPQNQFFIFLPFLMKMILLVGILIVSFLGVTGKAYLSRIKPLFWKLNDSWIVNENNLDHWFSY